MRQDEERKTRPLGKRRDRYESLEREEEQDGGAGKDDKKPNRSFLKKDKSFGGKPRYGADNRDKPKAFYGIVEEGRRNSMMVRPTNRNQKFVAEVAMKHLDGAQDGEIVFISRVEEEVSAFQKEKLRQRGKKPRLGPYVVQKKLGSSKDVRNYSLLSLLEAGLQPNFPPKVRKACDGFKVPELGDREDLRDLPLVTIDGEDARDFDDAVYCRPDPDNGGYYAIIAIADVSHYVRQGEILDIEAYRRGNSTYFPDRVVPMLPEALSNDLCSLRPNEDRACMHVHVWIDEEGQIADWDVGRGLMRSHARLTYNQVQKALDGQPDETTKPLLDELQHLYKAFQLLFMARKNRGALEIETVERQIIMDGDGGVKAVIPKERLEAHQLIEEFMITANVVVAHALEAKEAPCMYRVHDNPSPFKMASLREFIKPLGIEMPIDKEHVVPASFNDVLERAKEIPALKPVINTLVLRSQAQAVYTPDNNGHFGLALEKYAHFTSPIRRYADLINHRSLITAYELGDDGLSENDYRLMAEWGEIISATERNSMVAERGCVDRFTAHFLQTQIGKEVEGRITSVLNFGLFVSVLDGIGEALIPIRMLPQDYYDYYEEQHVLVGGSTGIVYRLGAPITIMITAVDPILGSVSAQVVGKESSDLPGFKTPKPSGRSRGGFGGDRKPRRDEKRPFKERQDKGKAKRGKTNNFKDGGGRPKKGPGGGFKGKKKR